MMKKYIFAFLACLSISFSSLIVEAAAATEEYSYDGMGRVVLEKILVNNVNTLTQNMFYKTGSRVPNTNTIFVIQYNFVLAEDITIPDGCVLKFDGGSISGGYKLNLNGCYIEGLAQFGNGVTFSGSIRNGMFNVMWLMDSDFGAKVNRAAQYFNNLYSPAIYVEYSTPIDINIMYGQIHFDSKITYVGPITNLGSAFKLRADRCKVYINSLKRKGTDSHPEGIDYSENRKINFIGINIYNSNCSDFHIEFINGFNEGVRCSGIGSGCCDNNLYVGTLWNYNFGVRIYQCDVLKHIGWCNGWDISGGCWRSFGRDDIKQKHAIFIGGAGAENQSYKDNNIVDTHNGNSNIVIRHIDFENHNYPIYIQGLVSYISIEDCREENSIGLIKAINTTVSGIHYVPGYVNVIGTSDVQNAQIEGDFFKKIYEAEKPQGSTLYPYNNILAKPNSVNVDRAGGWDAMRGIIIDTTKQKMFYMNSKTTNTNSGFHCIYLNDDGTDRIANQKNYPDPRGRSNTTAMWDSDFNCWECKNFIKVPSNVKKIWLGLARATYFNNAFAIYSVGEAEIIAKNSDNDLCGETSKRPATLELGKSYFDTTINKPIWWNGTAWVDGTGKAM